MPLVMSVPGPQEFLICGCLLAPLFEVPVEFTDEPTNDRGQTGAQGRLLVSGGEYKEQFIFQPLGGADGKGGVAGKLNPVEGYLSLVVSRHENHLQTREIQ